MYKRIVVPLDGSELAEQVLPTVIELANCTGAEISLLRVPEFPVFEYLMPPPEVGRTLQEQARDEARQYLDRLATNLRESGLRVRTQVVVDDAVYSTILSIAQESGADLIAMSTHGRTGLARMVMGSVADDVVRHTDLPVLLVRPQPVSDPLSAHFDTAYKPLPVN